MQNGINWFQTAVDIIQAVISGIFVGLVIYWLDERRAKRDRRLSDFRIASNWFQSEPKVSLRNFDLSEKNLAGHNFTKANLEDAILIGADLWATILNEANLRRANFRKARLTGTKLVKAIARGADFSGAKIYKRSYPDFIHLPDFSKAELQRCKFVGAHLDGVLMADANLSRSDFSKAIIVNCDFSGSDLTSSNWKKVKKVESCIWKNVKVDLSEDFPKHLWEEIQKQNAIPVRKKRVKK